MSKKKRTSLSVSFGENGLPFLPLIKNAELDYEILSSGVLEIQGNKQGLILLAKALLGLAMCNDQNGYHVHLDDLYKINNYGHDFVIVKRDQSEPRLNGSERSEPVN